MDKWMLLDRCAADSEERVTLARILDKLERTRKRNILSTTDFLSPQEQAAAESLLRQAGVRDHEMLARGGYAEAERKILLFLPSWIEDPADVEVQSPLRCLRCEFRAEYQLTHRDFLGSLMGMGIVREKVGDILVSDENCDLIVLDTVADFLLQSWNCAGRAKFSVREIPAEELRVPELRFEEIRDTVSSLRLDAVAACGFRTSRTKAAELIAAGRVQVNWRECQKPDRLLKERDTVSVRGLGKFTLEQVGGLSRKGRTGIRIKRYI